MRDYLKDFGTDAALVPLLLPLCLRFTTFTSFDAVTTRTSIYTSLTSVVAVEVVGTSRLLNQDAALRASLSLRSTTTPHRQVY